MKQQQQAIQYGLINLKTRKVLDRGNLTTAEAALKNAALKREKSPSRWERLQPVYSIF